MALDKLNEMAVSETHSKVNIISICCGSTDQIGCDAAREIIEMEAETRWPNLRHFFIMADEKERAKAQYGFSQVPFYVVLNSEGEIQQKGSSKQVNLDEAPGVERIAQADPSEEKKDDRVFCIDEDF